MAAVRQETRQQILDGVLGTPLARPNDVERLVYDDPMEPGGELGVAFELRARLERRNEPLMHRLAGIVLGFQDPAGHRQKARRLLPDERFERGGVAGSHALDERIFHQRNPTPAPGKWTLRAVSAWRSKPASRSSDASAGGRASSMRQRSARAPAAVARDSHAAHQGTALVATGSMTTIWAPRDAASSRCASAWSRGGAASSFRLHPQMMPVAGRFCVWRSTRARASTRSPRLVRPVSPSRSEEHTSELQSRLHLVCRLLLEKEKFVRQVITTILFRIRKNI